MKRFWFASGAITRQSGMWNRKESREWDDWEATEQTVVYYSQNITDRATQLKFNR
jgi:hypothetical protein